MKTLEIEKQPLRVLLADDHVVLTEGIRSMLEPDYELVEVVADGHELVEAAVRLQPDVIVADLSMPSLRGIDALRQIREHNENVKVIFLTTHHETELAAEAFRAGASGYVLKTDSSASLIQALDHVSNGLRFLTPALNTSLSALMLQHPYAPPVQRPSLTPRQTEVLKLIAAGRSGKEIASILNVSLKTVEFHKYRMTEKLDLHTTAELTRYAIKNGIVSP
jgi:DNA-binding NarL/FixJ family response regulator